MDELISNPKFVQDYLASRERLFADLKEKAEERKEAPEALDKQIEEKLNQLDKLHREYRTKATFANYVRCMLDLWIPRLESDNPKPERTAREMRRFKEEIQEFLDG